MIMKGYLEKAGILASRHTYPDELDYHLCALIVRGGVILSTGYNRFGSSGLIQHYRPKDRIHQYNVHAETDAILKVRQRIDLTGSKLYVTRIGKNRGPNNEYDYAMAMPCEMCQAVIGAYGIRKVFFTIDNQTWGETRIAG